MSLSVQGLPNHTSTRLLTLAPSPDFEAAIIASLSNIDLADPNSLPGAYEAISYTWGEFIQDDQHAITIDNQVVLVRTNLYNALRRLRHPAQPRTLWCDFLCISQTDLREKEQQVQMIGQIFASAERVLVWLGEHADGSEKLFDTRDWRCPPEQHHGSRKDWKQKLLDIKSETEISQEASRARIWADLFLRAYWRRTWIIQELRLAREIIIHVGQDSLPWTVFITNRFTKLGMHSTFDNIHPAGFIDNRSFQDPRFLLNASLSWISKFVAAVPIDNPSGKAPGHVIMDDWEDQSNNIFNIISTFRDTCCYDPRDKIYALRSLEKTDRPLVVDYEIDLPNLLLSLYEQRYVYDEALASGSETQTRGKKGILSRLKPVLLDIVRPPPPDTSGVIDSLGLDKAQCEVVAQLALRRSEEATAEGKEGVARCWKRVAKAVMEDYQKLIEQREWNEAYLEGRAWQTHPPPSRSEKTFWLGRRKGLVLGG